MSIDKIKRIVKTECWRFLSWKKIGIGTCLIGLIFFLSVADSISLKLIGVPDELKMSICDKFQEVLEFDRYKSLLVLASSLCIVTSFAKEEQNHFFRYLLLRENLKYYVIARIIAVVLYVPICMILGILLAAISILPFSVINGKGGAIFGVYSFLNNGNWAWLYLILLAWNYAMAIVPVCCIGILVSIWNPNPYVALGSTFFSFYSLYAITNRLPYCFSFSYLSSTPGIYTLMGLPYRILVDVLFLLLVAKWIYKALLWRRDEGII